MITRLVAWIGYARQSREQAASACHCPHFYTYGSRRTSAGARLRIYEQYQKLSAKVLRSGGIDVRLKRWSQGLVENSTFQQMTEEFAELVIPRIWLREARNTSRVVAKLSISPKKVRRILAKAGLKG